MRDPMTRNMMMMMMMMMMMKKMALRKSLVMSFLHMMHSSYPFNCHSEPSLGSYTVDPALLLVVDSNQLHWKKGGGNN